MSPHVICDIFPSYLAVLIDDDIINEWTSVV
jgi:hypothetical protein